MGSRNYLSESVQDRYPDILLGDNRYGVKPEVGCYAASYGTLLHGNGDGAFSILPPKQSGFKLEDEVGDIVSIEKNNEKRIIVSRNNELLQIFQY